MLQLETVFILLLFIFLFVLFFIPDIMEKFEQKNHIKKNNVVHNSNQIKLQKFNKETNILVQNQENPKTFRKLFEKFYNGIDDSYDLNGNTIPGIEPNPLRAIDYLKKLINSEYGKSNDVLQLAKIYHQGMHLMEPDLEKAKQTYTDILNNCGQTEMRNEAWEGLKDIDKIKALKWLNLPPDHDPKNAGKDNHIIQDTVINVPQDIIEIIDNDTINLNRAILMQINQPEPIEVLELLDEAELYGTQFHNDSQNTHDSQVISTVRHSLDNIIKSTNVDRTLQQSMQEIEGIINKLPKNDKTSNAKKALQYINQSDEILSKIEKTNKDVLNIIWNRIHNDINKNNKDNLIDSLINNLSEMIVHNNIVCQTGIMDRIVDTLNIIDPEVSIKPSYAINAEMMEKSAFIRRKKLKELPTSQSEMLERGTHPNQMEFDKKLKNDIVITLTNDYVNTGILTKEKFKTEIEKWINEI